MLPLSSESRFSISSLHFFDELRFYELISLAGKTFVSVLLCGCTIRICSKLPFDSDKPHMLLGSIGLSKISFHSVLFLAQILEGATTKMFLFDFEQLS